MEALGGAASVIGVTSLAIQLCEELQKIHDFWQSVKEAPDDIAHISTEVNLFMTWLAVITNNYQRQGFNHRSPNHIATINTLKLCLATVNDMNDGVKDLESRLSTGLLSKRWVSVKFVFRKEKREKVMQQIERMKSLLIIVQTCYIGEMQEASFKSLSMSLRPKDSALQTTTSAQFLEMSAAAPTNENSVIGTQEVEPTAKSPVAMVSFDPKASPQASHSSQRKTTKQEEGAYNFGLAMLRYVSTEQESVFVGDSGDERRIPARRTRCDLRIAQWLLSRGFSWQSSGMYGSWQYSFRTFRYIPPESLIVEFCLEGDIANVQRMFDKGLASPFDRVRWEHEDWSLLHFSALHCHAQLCRFLIRCGLGRGSASGLSRVPILAMPGLRNREWQISNPTTHLDTLRIMINEGQYDPMENASDTSVMHSFGGSPTVYRWLLDQEDFLIDFEQTAHKTRTIAGALISSRLGSPVSSCLEALIAHGSGLNTLTGQQWMGPHFSLAHEAIVDLEEVAELDDFPKRIKVLLDAGADFNTPPVNNPFGTTLDLLFGSFAVSISKEHRRRSKDRTFEVKRESIPAAPLMSEEGIIEYDRLEDSSGIEFRPRTPKSLWRTWYPGDDLSVLEVAQRYLDTWMEILLEAGLDIADYGWREDQMHPEGLLFNDVAEAWVHFEYGDHVSGCRIHVTEIWIKDLDREDDNAESLTMPGSWDFGDK